MWSGLLLMVLGAQAATLAEARAAERKGAWTTAAGIYATLAEEGSEPARRRLAWLTDRQDADGDWDSLEALDRSRRGQGPAAAEQVLVTAGAAPLVQHEAALWLAAQALDADQPALALGHTQGAWTARGTLSRAVLGQVVRLRAAALSALGRFDEARAVEQVIAVVAPVAQPSKTDRMERAAQHQAVTAASGLVLLVLGLGLLPGAWRGWRRAPRPRPWGLVPLVLLLAGTACIAELREDGSGRWGLRLTVAASVLHLLSVGSARGRGRLGRVVVGAAAGLATLAAAWICVWSTESLGDLGL